jgi:hypothetical protein
MRIVVSYNTSKKSKTLFSFEDTDKKEDKDASKRIEKG